MLIAVGLYKSKYANSVNIKTSRKPRYFSTTKGNGWETPNGSLSSNIK